MKKSEKKECPVPSMDQEPKVTGCEQNSTCVPSLDQVGKCLTLLMYELIVSLNEKSPLSLKDETALLSEKRLNIKFFFNNFNFGVLNLLDNKIEYNQARIEMKDQCKNNKIKTDSGEPFQQINGQNKAFINCGIMDFGRIVGSIVENLKNKDGDHIIKVDATDLAIMLHACCTLPKGKEFKNDTLAISIGKGRKEPSIIDEKAMAAFYKIDEV